MSPRPKYEDPLVAQQTHQRCVNGSAARHGPHRELVDDADKALYQAKANGRDCCELIEPVIEEPVRGPRLVA
jgi:predicted signal transduction protein with EAL and GGDEF domain